MVHQRPLETKTDMHTKHAFFHGRHFHTVGKAQVMVEWLLWINGLSKQKQACVYSCTNTYGNLNFSLFTFQLHPWRDATLLVGTRHPQTAISVSLRPLPNVWLFKAFPISCELQNYICTVCAPIKKMTHRNYGHACSTQTNTKLLQATAN